MKYKYIWTHKIEDEYFNQQKIIWKRKKNKSQAEINIIPQ